MIQVFTPLRRGLVLGLLLLLQLNVQAAKQPNIVFLLADDQRSDVLGCYGNEDIQTPTIDRLAEKGLLFNNSFCEVPICAATRASLVTGLSQRTHGYNFGEKPVVEQQMSNSYPALLKQAGYRVGFAGKYGFKHAGPKPQKLFDFFKTIGRDPYLKKMPDGSLRHETDLCADAAIEFIKSNKAGQPFCMSVSFNASHAEDKDHRPGFHFQWPESTDGMYEDLDLTSGPRLGDRKHFKAMPEFLQEEVGLSRTRYFWRWDTPEKYQTNMRAYYRMITGIDFAIARIVEALEAEGLTDNTIIVYTADNGLLLGDRGTAGKWNHYEQSLRVPLVIYDPRLPESVRGTKVDGLVTNLDIAPTFLELAGARIPRSYQGQSLLPWFNGQAVTNWRDSIFTEHAFYAYDNWYGVRSERYKLASYYTVEDAPYYCLYDLQKDPDELTNLAKNPEYASLLSQMKKRLAKYLDDYPEDQRPKKFNDPSQSKF